MQLKEMNKEKQSAVSGTDKVANGGSFSAPTKLLQIAIDGPAGAGKSTVAKKVADVLGYLYIDTGAMYRAVTWLSMKLNLQMSDRQGITKLAAESNIELRPPATAGELMRVFINGEEVTKEIRTQKVTQKTSTVAAFASVREHMVEQQRQMAKKGGVVLDGRDIGTVVLPDADLKIFLTASAEVRAKRRLAELIASGEHPDYPALLKDIIDRDQKDSNRVIAPLRMADDSILLLTDNMTAEEVVSHIVQLCSN
jgi:cytidylate kinase